MSLLQDVHGGGRLLWKLAAFFLVLAFVGLLHAADKPVPRLQHGFSSANAVALRVLEALREQDMGALVSLALSREEFRQHVWPELPVSNPRTNVSLDYVWNDVWFRSVNRMKGMFQRFKGQKLSLVTVAHRGKVAAYPKHKAYPDWEIVIRDSAGRQDEYPLFGTLIEMDGFWKVYSYAPYD